MHKSSVVNVLLIETDSELRNGITSMLLLNGHGVTSTENVGKAADLITSIPYDVIIYSFNPGQVQLSEVVLNAKLCQPQVKVIVANDYPVATDGFYDMTIDAHIKKPFSLLDLQKLTCATVHQELFSMPGFSMSAKGSTTCLRSRF